MGIIRGTSFFLRGCFPAAFALALLGAIVMLPPAAAQDAGKSKPAAAQPPLADNDYLGKIGRWFDEQGAKFRSNFDSAKNGVDNFGHEAGVAASAAAKVTVDTAKDAAEAVGHLTTSHLVRGHEKCIVAANGAPDCVAAATAVCKAQGYNSGKSADMTTAEDCPPKVFISGRTPGDNECKTVTFVSRALCQ